MKPMRSTLNQKLIVVIDDDPLVLAATGGLLRSCGCQVVTADCYDSALDRLAEFGRRPDLIVCDYRLSAGENGVAAIAGLRNAFEIPARLISADAASPPSDPATGAYNLLHKPLDASKFRAALVNASVLRP